MKKTLVHIIIITLFATRLFAYQWLAPNNDVMTSSFAEFRVAHFHGGTDLRAIEGSPIVAPANGWVQKVSVSPFGYGRAMYFVFDDSVTLVLGHLSRYPQDVEVATVKEQFEKKSQSVEKWFLKSEFTFKKGETIAYSGETGIGKPHIHYETRHKKDVYVSPHLYGFVPPDVMKPTIEAIALMPLSPNAWIEESSAPQMFLPKDAAWNGKTLRIWGEIGLGVDFYDKTAEANANRLGARKVQMFLDSTKVFGCVYDSFSAEETVDIGYLYDGGLEALFGRRFHKLFVPGGTKLTLFELPTPAQGIIDASKLGSGEHELRIYIEDFIGNASELKLKIIASQPERAELEIVGDKKTKKLALKTPPLNTVLEYCPKGKNSFTKIAENVSEVRIDTLNGAFRARGLGNRQILPNYVSTFAPTDFKSDKCSLFVCGKFLYYLVELDVPPSVCPILQ
jgi:hypothetical protein